MYQRGILRLTKTLPLRPTGVDRRRSSWTLGLVGRGTGGVDRNTQTILPRTRDRRVEFLLPSSLQVLKEVPQTLGGTSHYKIVKGMISSCRR